MALAAEVLRQSKIITGVFTTNSVLILESRHVCGSPLFSDLTMKQQHTAAKLLLTYLQTLGYKVKSLTVTLLKQLKL